MGSILVDYARNRQRHLQLVRCLRISGCDTFLTAHSQTLNEIMPMIYRRFTEKSAEEWRQIYKALQLLEFLIKHGSERVIDDARGHVTLLKMLRQFQFIDANGKDQGLNVRNRAKELTELLGDVDRIRSERKKARATKNKYTGVEGGNTLGGFSGSSRYGGFGPESSGGGSASFGGYSGGVYGDGGGFGGQSNDYNEGGASRSDRFEEYDEFDEGDRPAAGSSSTRRTRNERPGTKKTTPEVAKPKEPEVDLFSFDEPVASSSTPAPAGGSGLAGLGSSSSHVAAASHDDDDEFDDFQSAAPASQSSGLPATFGLPLAAPVVAPAQPSASQAFAALSPSSSTSATPGANYSAFTAPTQAAKSTTPATFQPAAPNYFGGVQSQASTQASTPSFATTANSGPTTMANTRPVVGNSKPSTPAAGGDAFGALWGKASAGIKKSNTTSSGPALGQLAKEKSSASIWGSPAPNSQTPGGGSASGDLLG